MCPSLCRLSCQPDAPRTRKKLKKWARKWSKHRRLLSQPPRRPTPPPPPLCPSRTAQARPRLRMAVINKLWKRLVRNRMLNRQHHQLVVQVMLRQPKLPPVINSKAPRSRLKSPKMTMCLKTTRTNPCQTVLVRTNGKR
uniref:Uncharacterized protein n=1 Tax=Cacopsylla melanoneura TaxID=428564 RepID=A0A8D8ZIB6_9HEMI